MILLTLPLVIAGLVAGLFVYLRARSGAGRLWRSAISIGLSIGVARAIFASLGWYTVEHTGGPLQVPGFVLAMLSWPEAAVLPRTRVATTPPEFYLLLSVVLITSTLTFACLVAAVVHYTAPRGRG